MLEVLVLEESDGLRWSRGGWARRNLWHVRGGALGMCGFVFVGLPCLVVPMWRSRGSLMMVVAPHSLAQAWASLAGST